MSFNKGKYEPNVVKETIMGKDVKCNICGLGIDGTDICLEIGNDFIFKIMFASFDIDPEGYFWELSVVPMGDSPIVDASKMKESIITDLNVIDNFYEQCSQQRD
jgi:hypothetical protein